MVGWCVVVWLALWLALWLVVEGDEGAYVLDGGLEVGHGEVFGQEAFDFVESNGTESTRHAVLGLGGSDYCRLFVALVGEPHGALDGGKVRLERRVGQHGQRVVHGTMRRHLVRDNTHNNSHNSNNDERNLHCVRHVTSFEEICAPGPNPDLDPRSLSPQILLLVTSIITST